MCFATQVTVIMEDENNVEKSALEDDTLDVSEEDEDVDDETAKGIVSSGSIKKLSDQILSDCFISWHKGSFSNSDAMERGDCDKCNDIGQEDGTQPKKHIPVRLVYFLFIN